MSDPKIVEADLTGGCQCGRVRFRATMVPSDVSYCHCRMCQRAVGNVFATFAMVRRDRLEWTKDVPAIFESSTVAERGFCPACGTPLSFAYKASRNIELTVGSFDDPTLLRPMNHYGIESRVPWCIIDDHLPRRATDLASSNVKGLRSRQDPAEA